jgi:hypothetical protein
VPSNITLSELKERTAIKLQILPESQSMTLKVVNRIIPLEKNECTLTELGIKNMSKIFLEQTNINENEQEGSSDEEIDMSPNDTSNLDTSPKNVSVSDASKMLSNLRNPKYFLKLGIMKKQLTAADMEDVDEVAAVIDELIEKIKIDCSPTMFFNDYEQAKKELDELNIKNDLSINTVSTQGWTCLHAACQYGNEPLVQFLLSTLKCDPNILSNDGWAALHIASHLGFYEIVDLLLKDKRTKSDKIGNEENGTGLH